MFDYHWPLNITGLDKDALCSQVHRRAVGLSFNAVSRALVEMEER